MKMIFIPVPDRTERTLVVILEKYIRAETTIISDCWRSYDCLGEHNFQHLKVNHSVIFKDPETGACTNMIECIWRHAKQRIPPYNRKRGNFFSYLSYYVFRSRCKSLGQEMTSELRKIKNRVENKG